MRVRDYKLPFLQSIIEIESKWLTFLLQLMPRMLINICLEFAQLLLHFTLTITLTPLLLPSPLPTPSNRHPRGKLQLTLFLLTNKRLIFILFVYWRLRQHRHNFFHLKLFRIFGRKFQWQQCIGNQLIVMVDDGLPDSKYPILFLNLYILVGNFHIQIIANFIYQSIDNSILLLFQMTVFFIGTNKKQIKHVIIYNWPFSWLVSGI